MTYIATELEQVLDIRSIVTIHYFEYMKDFTFSGEQHDFWEFLYVDRGKILVTAGSERIALQTGSIIFHQPDEFHAIDTLPGAAPNLIVGSFICHSALMDAFVKATLTLNMGERQMLANILYLAQVTLDTPLNIPSVEKVSLNPNAPEGSQQLLLLELQKFLLTLYQRCLSKPRTDALLPEKLNYRHLYEMSSTPYEDEELFDQIVRYMNNHIYEHLTLETIASDFSFSPSSIEKHFRQRAGHGVMYHFNHLKIQRAKELIADDKLIITQISYILGFSSPQYFSLRFKEKVGMSPQEYRRTLQSITRSLKRNHTEA